MHRCLQISEILTRILEFCSGFEFEKSHFDGLQPPSFRYYGYQELLATARTCKAFYEPLMDIIYHCIPCLSVVFRCLPKALWRYKRDGVYKSDSDSDSDLDSDSDSDSDSEFRSPPKKRFYLKSYPGPDEWCLVEKHARRVKQLIQLNSRGKYLFNSSCVMEAIGRRCISRGWDQDPFKAFLPNLIELVWHCEYVGGSDATLLYLPMIPGPSLRRFWFRDEYVDIREPISFGVVSKALTTCIKAQHYIKELHVDRGSLSGWDGLHSCIPSHITHLQGLRHFSCSGHDINCETISYLSQLPGLQFMRIPFPAFGDASIFRTTSSQNFLELTDLHLKAPNLKSSMDLLNFISSTKLARIHLKYPAAKPVKADVAELFDALCRHSLVHILTIEDDNDYLEMNDLSDPDRTITSPIFDPLLRLRSICHLKIDLKMGVDIDDTTIVSMAKAWPQLVSLHIIPGKPLSTPPQVTLSGIGSLIHECPSFDFLNIAFNPVLPFDREENSCYSQQLCIHFWTPIEDVVAAADAVKYIFPICGEDISVDPVGQHTEEICEQWGALKEILERYASLRPRSPSPYQSPVITMDVLEN